MGTSATHLMATVRRTAFTRRATAIHRAGGEIVKRLPGYVQTRMQQAVRGEIKVGVCADFDNTLVPTDEVNRRFFVLGEDDVGCLEPLGGLAMLGTPVGAISGNVTGYIIDRFAVPLRDFLLGSHVPNSVALMAAYALNGGHLHLYDKAGRNNTPVMEPYNDAMRMPPDIHAALCAAMIKASREFTAKGMPLDKPLEVRGPHNTTIFVTAPILEDRDGVELCFVGVPGEERDAMVAAIASDLTPAVQKVLDILPAGQYSIDAMMRTLRKEKAGSHFAELFEIDWLFYLGDSVYDIDGKIGNDLPMAENLDTDVLAVNPKDKPVPERPCVHWIGHSPVATRDWMGWFLMERANHIYQNGDAADREMVWETFRYMGYAGPT